MSDTPAVDPPVPTPETGFDEFARVWADQIRAPSERVVWKYAANPKGVFRVPWDSDVVLFDYDPKTDSPWPHIWAETTPEHGPRTRTLVIHGTGHPVDGTWQASCVDRQTGLVWHLYDITTGPQAS